MSIFKRTVIRDGAGRHPYYESLNGKVLENCKIRYYTWEDEIREEIHTRDNTYGEYTVPFSTVYGYSTIIPRDVGLLGITTS